MLAAHLALLAGIVGLNPADGPDRTPLITAILPPGITRGSRTTWTIRGRNLDQVAAVVATDPGLRFEPPEIDPTGHSLTVVVAAGLDAPAGYHEIRADGPTGISNLAMVRVDALPQVVEVEPNDASPAVGQVIPVGTAVAGVIGPLDVDRFRVEGTPGQRVTLDWETRRLGTAILPVLTVTGPERQAIQQSRSSPGGDRDCRTSVLVPPAGWFEVELRDHTYGGDDRARYRLRVDPDPFATAMFPLGGPRSERLDLALGGGSLPAPVPVPVNLTAIGGAWLDPGPFVVPWGPPLALGPPPFAARARRFLSPGRVRVGDPEWPEVTEPVDLPPDQSWAVPGGSTGVTVNGRLDRAGQVDRFRVEARAGDRFRARVEAAAAGSWLDSVLTVVGPTGESLASNDDRKPRSLLEPPGTIDGSPTTDSEVDVLVKTDGAITVELADRFGCGGPEYGYRLELGPPRDDFSIHLLRTNESADPGPEARRPGDPDRLEPANQPTGPGTFGVFNLQPGSTTFVPVVILPRGRPGTIDIAAVGLPPSIHAERLTIRTAPRPRPGSRGASEWDAPAETHAFGLRVDPTAPPWSGTWQIIASKRVAEGANRAGRREADAIVGVDAAGGPERPVIRRLTRFPLRILSPGP